MSGQLEDVEPPRAYPRWHARCSRQRSMVLKSLPSALLALMLSALSATALAEPSASGVFAGQQHDSSTTGGGSESVRLTLGGVASTEGALGASVAADISVWKTLSVGPVALAAVGDELWLLAGLRAGLRLPVHPNIDLFPWLGGGAFYGVTFGSTEYGKREAVDPISPIAGFRAAYRAGTLVLGLEALATVTHIEYTESWYAPNPEPPRTDLEVLPFVGVFAGYSL